MMAVNLLLVSVQRGMFVTCRVETLKFPKANFNTLNLQLAGVQIGRRIGYYNNMYNWHDGLTSNNSMVLECRPFDTRISFSLCYMFIHTLLHATRGINILPAMQLQCHCFQGSLVGSFFIYDFSPSLLAY